MRYGHPSLDAGMTFQAESIMGKTDCFVLCRQGCRQTVIGLWPTAGHAVCRTVMAEPALLVWREQPVGVAAMRLQPSTRSIAYDVCKEIAGRLY